MNDLKDGMQYLRFFFHNMIFTRCFSHPISTEPPTTTALPSTTTGNPNSTSGNTEGNRVLSSELIT